MHIDIIDDYERFLTLKENWDAVYAADPEAQFFLSWTWVSKWLDKAVTEWAVLAARPDDNSSTYVAFFPLRIRAYATKNGLLYTDIWMACQGIADYSGFLCRPEAVSDTIPAFAECIKQMSWNNFSLGYFRASDERAKLLLDAFPRSHFKTKKETTTNNEGRYDNAICPYVDLPGDWDAYLENQVSTNTRQKIRRFLRKVETSDDYRITLTDTDTFEQNFDILTTLWEGKWGARKGQVVTEILEKIRHTMMAHCMEQGVLFMPVLWQGDRPLGILGSLVDHEKKEMLFFVAGRDLTSNNPPSGVVLHAYSIRHAIGLGLTTYDFLRGNEAYKYSFGPQERVIRNLSIERRTAKKQLDPRSLKAALYQTRHALKTGHLANAERGFRQILQVDPQSTQARLGLSQVLMAKGDRAGADKVLAEQAADAPLLVNLNARRAVKDQPRFRQRRLTINGARIAFALISFVFVTPGHAADGSIATLIDNRLALMKDVGAFKYLGDISVENKEREAVVLEQAVEHARDSGLDGEAMVPFFTAQIDAAKAIQHCWIARWQSGAAPAPTDVPDLQNTIRPRLIEIGDALIAAIAETLSAGGTLDRLGPPVLDCLPPSEAKAIIDSLVAIDEDTAP